VLEFIDRIVSGTTNEVGRRTLMMLIITLDMAGGGPFAASGVAAVGVGKTVDTVQMLFMGASQLVGLGILRCAVGAEPIASMKPGALADALAPTLQRCLVGDIS
jgi:Tetracyclin repressor-like, C-terminal domain